MNIIKIVVWDSVEQSVNFKIHRNLFVTLLYKVFMRSPSLVYLESKIIKIKNWLKN